MGRSKAQDELMARIQATYPDAYVSDEAYIGDLIEERGYTVKEIASELGHKVRKMFVDIIMRDADRTIAFEYHGEQHYATVGNMTKTTADLLLNQQLDREKSWILTRIGIPVVAVAFDAYIDEDVLEDMIDKAWEEVEQMRGELVECPNCSRLFPTSAMPLGICSACREREAEAAAFEREEREYEGRSRLRKKDDETAEEKKARRAAERAKRKEAYRAYKETPEYAARKEEEKKRRKEYNRQQREKRKAERKRLKEEGDYD